MKFEPSDDYECLKKQAYALFNIVKCKEQTEEIYRKKSDHFLKQEVERLKSELDSEREMNAILTSENEVLEQRIKLIENDR